MVPATEAPPEESDKSWPPLLLAYLMALPGACLVASAVHHLVSLVRRR